MMLSLGIDLSTSATGVVVLRSGGSSPELLLEHEINCKSKGMARNKQIVTELMDLIHGTKPERIVVEGYSLNMRHSSSVIPLVELGGLLRFMLHLDGLQWLDPRATEVKKFVTGKGNSPKEVVMMNVLKRWGHESKTNNTADAYVCACIGLAHIGKLPGATKEMTAIAGGLSLNSL